MSDVVDVFNPNPKKQNAKMATSTPESTTEGSNFSWGFLFNTEAFLRTWEFIR